MSEFEYESGSLANTARGVGKPFSSILTPGNEKAGRLSANLSLPAGSMYNGTATAGSTPSVQEQFDSLWNAKQAGDDDRFKKTPIGSDWAADTAAVGGLGLGFLGYLQNTKLMNEQMKGMRQDRRASKEYNDRQVAKTNSINSALGNINVNPRQQTA